MDYKKNQDPQKKSKNILTEESAAQRIQFNEDYNRCHRWFKKPQKSSIKLKYIAPCTNPLTNCEVYIFVGIYGLSVNVFSISLHNQSRISSTRRSNLLTFVHGIFLFHPLHIRLLSMNPFSSALLSVWSFALFVMSSLNIQISKYWTIVKMGLFT